MTVARCNRLCRYVEAVGRRLVPEGFSVYAAWKANQPMVMEVVLFSWNDCVESVFPIEFRELVVRSRGLVIHRVKKCLKTIELFLVEHPERRGKGYDGLEIKTATPHRPPPPK